MSNLATLPALQIFSKQLNIEPLDLIETLKSTVFSQGTDKNGQKKDPPTDAQMKVLLLVANEYKLNPFTKEIYAFPSKAGGIVPFISIDGWIKLMNSHPQSDGVEVKYADITTSITGDRFVNRAKVKFKTKTCPEWAEAIIYRKDKNRPTIIREYFEEVFRVSEPWIQHTRRMLRHKAIIQCARVAFGFSGIYDRDEAERIIEIQEGETVEGQAVVVVEDHSAKQKALALMRQKIAEMGSKEDDLCTKFGIESLESMELSRIEKGLKWCDDEIAKKQLEDQDNGAYKRDQVG